MTIDTEDLAGGESSPFEASMDRRGLLLNAAKLTAAAAAAGPFFMASKQAAAAVYASTSAAAGDPIALGAVNAAKKYSGEEITFISEAQLQEPGRLAKEAQQVDVLERLPATLAYLPTLRAAWDGAPTTEAVSV